jgi:hypothetical protein
MSVSKKRSNPYVEERNDREKVKVKKDMTVIYCNSFLSLL